MHATQRVISFCNDADVGHRSPRFTKLTTGDCQGGGVIFHQISSLSSSHFFFQSPVQILKKKKSRLFIDGATWIWVYSAIFLFSSSHGLSGWLGSTSLRLFQGSGWATQGPSQGCPSCRVLQVTIMLEGKFSAKSGALDQCLLATKYTWHSQGRSWNTFPPNPQPTNQAPKEKGLKTFPLLHRWFQCYSNAIIRFLSVQ